MITLKNVSENAYFKRSHDSFDVQVSHARSQGIGYYPKTAYLQKDGNICGRCMISVEEM